MAVQISERIVTRIPFSAHEKNRHEQDVRLSTSVLDVDEFSLDKWYIYI